MFNYIVKTIILRFLLGLSILILLYSLNKVVDKYYKTIKNHLNKVKTLRQNLILYGASSYYENKLLSLSKKQFKTLTYNYLNSLGYDDVQVSENEFFDFICRKNKETYLVKSIPYNIDENEISFEDIYKLVGFMLKDNFTRGVVLTPYDINTHRDILCDVSPLNIIIEDKNTLTDKLLKYNIEI